MIRLMIGRDLKSLYMPPASAARRERARDRRPAHRRPIPAARSSLAVRQRRDPRPRRPGRLRPHRARPRRLRHRPPARRRDRARRRADRHRARRATRSTSGIYLVPEDRKRSGLLLDVSIAENISLPDLPSYARGLSGRRRRARPRMPSGRSSALGIKAPSVATARRHAVRRQPAEGRAGQMAVDAARA